MKFLKSTASAFTMTLTAANALSGIDINIDSPWTKISDNVAFQQNTNINSADKKGMDNAAEEAIHRFLGSQKTGQTTDFGVSPYENGMLSTGTEWNSYQLAWRLLGYYVDCNQNGNNKNRNLKDDGGGGDACTRYVMYAVYVDPYYLGGGIGEYTYYTRETDEFQCYQGGSCRAKMDCHLPNTHWQLLGLFKINSLSGDNGWMEQLFKHEGVCVWGEDTYKFASNMRKNLPNQCKNSKQTDEKGNYLYYAVKPAAQGNITIGLYTDNVCSVEYGGKEYDVWTLSGYSQYYFEAFNDALDTYKICQPCISYSLSEDGFNCYDDAGYTNCNQCMKFSAKAGCTAATMDDVKLALRQQGLAAFEMYGGTYGSGGIGRTTTNLTDVAKTYVTTQLKVSQVTVKTQHAVATRTSSYFEKVPYYLPLSMAFFMASICVFVKSLRTERRYNKDKAKPLLEDSRSFEDTRSKDLDTESSDESASDESGSYRGPRGRYKRPMAIGNKASGKGSSATEFQQSCLGESTAEFQQSCMGNSLASQFPGLETFQEVKFVSTFEERSTACFPTVLPLGAQAIEAPSTDQFLDGAWASAESDDIGGRGTPPVGSDLVQRYIQTGGSGIDSEYIQRFGVSGYDTPNLPEDDKDPEVRRAKSY